MQRTLATTLAVWLVLVLLPTASALAQTALVSRPLPRSTDGALVCSCYNLTKKHIQVIMLVGNQTQNTPILADLDPGEMHHGANSTADNGVCRVYEFTGRSINAKQVDCSLVSVNANNGPMAVEPVNIKYKMP